MNLSINSTSQAFTSKYKLDVNQPVANQEQCLKRDTYIGVWTTRAKNGQEVTTKLNNFFKNEYAKNPKAPCPIELDIVDKDNNLFEAMMTDVGQKFSKIG